MRTAFVGPYRAPRLRRSIEGLYLGMRTRTPASPKKDRKAITSNDLLVRSQHPRHTPTDRARGLLEVISECDVPRIESTLACREIALEITV